MVKLMDCLFKDHSLDAEIIFVEDGEKLLDLMTDQEPQLLITDLFHPGPDGLTLIQKIRQQPQFRHTQTLLLTGTSLPFEAYRVADDCIMKPFDTEELIAKIQWLLQRKTDRFSARPGRREQSEASTGTESHNPLKEVRTLIVDDDRTLSEGLAERLQGPGRTFEIMADGLDAMVLLSKNTYDILITDLHHPGLSGLEMLRKIKSDVKWNGLHILVLSRNGKGHMAVEALNEGADYVLPKPCFEEEFLRVFKWFERLTLNAQRAREMGASLWQ